MVALYVLLFLVLAVLLASAYCFRLCFYSPKDRREDPYKPLEGEQYASLNEGIFYCTRRMEEAKCRFVDIRAWDGTKLSARYYHHADGAPLMILFHGYRSMALRDSAGGYILGRKAGFNVLAVDQRAHGRSGGRVITFGVKERKDCLSWIEFANRALTFGAPIVISGLSMGAATVLMASDLPLPENVVGIHADCPYDSPSGIIRKVGAEAGYPEKLVYPFVWLGAFLFGRFRLDSVDALSCVARSDRPIPLIHGEDDRFVPCQMSRNIAKANASCRLVTVPDAGHGLCYTVDPKGYERAVYEFLASLPALKAHMENNEYVADVLKTL